MTPTTIFKHLSDDLFAGLFFGAQETICVLVAHNVQKGEWACQVPFFPPYETKEVSQQVHKESSANSLLAPKLGLQQGVHLVVVGISC